MKNAPETSSTNASFFRLKKILFFDFRKIVIWCQKIYGQTNKPDEKNEKIHRSAGKQQDDQADRYPAVFGTS